MIIPMNPDDPYRAVKVDVSATRKDQLGAAALTEAAEYLGEPVLSLYIAEVIRPHVTEYSPYRPNLNAPQIPLRYGGTVVVRLRPDVVEARRGRLKGAKRDHLRKVPSVEEDDDTVS